jgi:hypothetical protein
VDFMSPTIKLDLTLSLITESGRDDIFGVIDGVEDASVAAAAAGTISFRCCV